MLHFSVLFFNNLPHTALTYKLDGLYLWYLNCTGQYQPGWGMYNVVSLVNEQYVITVYNPDFPLTPYQHDTITHPRRLYLAESIRNAPEITQNTLAKKFLLNERKRRNLSSQHRIALTCSVWQVVDSETGEREQHITRWVSEPEK